MNVDRTDTHPMLTRLWLLEPMRLRPFLNILDLQERLVLWAV